eukprot:TRINITY_DN5169_c0_g1_i1.p2 TRINITY_DN5169_c0_g1~~TRINITY_DN5169_c0_g1_i1.p2  ORF type:complete len:153 (-),score=73.88 TRINITY_DN5169_c0_g1_i1:185-604(-)
MSSGVGVNDEVVSAYNELKLSHKSRYIILQLSTDLKQVVVAKRAPTTATWADFIAELPKDDCRYGVFDLEFKSEDGDRSKLVFVLWAPDTAKTKPKMIYTSSKGDLRKSLVGIGVEIQATDRSEIDLEAVLDKAKKATR